MARTVADQMVETLAAVGVERIYGIVAMRRPWSPGSTQSQTTRSKEPSISSLRCLNPVSSRNGVVAFFEEEVEETPNVVVIFDNQNPRSHLLVSNAQQIPDPRSHLLVSNAQQIRNSLISCTGNFGHLHRLLCKQNQPQIASWWAADAVAAGVLTSRTSELPAQLVLCLLQNFSLRCWQVRSRSVDVKGQHGDGGPKGAGLASPAFLGGSLQ